MAKIRFQLIDNQKKDENKIRFQLIDKPKVTNEISSETKPFSSNSIIATKKDKTSNINLPIAKNLKNANSSLPLIPMNTKQETPTFGENVINTIANGAKTIGGTALATANYIGQGVMKGAETIGDTALQLGTSKANPYYWFNPDKLESHQSIAKELIQKDATKDYIEKTLGGGENFNQRVLDKNSLIKSDNLGGKVVTAIGQMLPSIATGSAMAGMTVLGTQAYGGGIEEAYNEGASRNQANLYGLGSAATEIATEWLTGGIPGIKGSGGLDRFVAKGLGQKSIDEISNSMTKEIIKAGYKMAGEGMEEALSEMINPILKNATYSKNEKIKWDDVFESAIIGAITGGILEAPANIYNIKGAMNNKTGNINTNINENNTQVEEKTQNSTNVSNDVQNLQNKLPNKQITSDLNEQITQMREQEQNTSLNDQITKMREQDLARKQVNEQKRLTNQVNQIENKVDKLSDTSKTFAQDNKTAKIQGLENYSTEEVKSIVNNYIKEILEDNNIDPSDVEIVDSELHGSRLRGMAKNNSDLDVVVQYKGNMKEDSLFNILNDENLEIDGVKVDINPIQETLSNYMKRSNEYDLKKKQISIINESNPMQDDYHTGIRSVDDIKTLQETLNDSDYEGYDEFNPDLTRKDIENAIKKGTITVYSSYPIENGVFVSPSRMEAESYSGNGKVYSKEVPIQDVAWIDPTQGQYAKINNIEERQAVSDNLESYTAEEVKSILRKDNNVIVNNKQELAQYVEEALNNPNSNKNLHLGIIPNETIQKIKSEIKNIQKDRINGLFKNDINYALAVNQSEIRHMKKPSLSQQDIVNFIDSVDELISQFDSVDYSLYNNQNALRFKKNMSDGTHIALEVISNKNHTLRTQTLFLDQVDFENKKKNLSPTLDELNSPSKTSEMDGLSVLSTNDTTTKSQKSQLAPVSLNSMQQKAKSDTKLPVKEASKKITEELEDLYRKTKVQIQDDDVKGTPFNTLTGYGDKTVLIQVKGNLKNINGVDVGIYKDSSGNWHVIDLKSNFALDRKNYKTQKEAIENATTVIDNFDLNQLRKNMQKRNSEAVDLTKYNLDDFAVEYDENGIGYPIEEEQTKLPTKNTINANKKSDVLKVESERIAEMMNRDGGLNIKERSWVETSTESPVLYGKVFSDDLDFNRINYTVLSNESSLQTANNKLNRMGYDKALEYVNNLTNNEHLPSASDMALAQRVLQEASKKGDVETVQNLIMDISILGTDLGQATQALSIINKLTPEGQLRMYTKIVDRAKARGEKSFQNVEITPEMVQNILEAYQEDGTYNQEDLNQRVEVFKRDIAKQLQTTTGEKINSWRYLSMLGNPKTHIRNIVSNIAMGGTIKVKNAMARTIETIAPIKNKTKTWKKASQTVQDFASKTALEMKDIITGEAKYNEKGAIESKKQIFKNKALEKISNFNSNALEMEDWFFSKRAFKDTLQEYLTANGITTQEDIDNNPEIVEKGKQYAVNQAEIATFRQYSALASKINQIERGKGKVAKLVIESTIPFKKTPINVAKAGVNYSPIGLIKNVSYDLYQLKAGNIEASQFIDNISQGLTGTSLMLIGYALAKAGFLKGAGDDDKESKYDYQLGQQTYSINVGDKSYSISWLSPVAIPLLVGANAYEQLEENKDWNMNVVTETMAKTLDPLNDMSFLSSLTDTLSSYNKGTDKIKATGESIVQNYVGQFFPTLFSQFASTLDDKKRSTKASNNSNWKFGEETVRKIAYKIPIARNQLEPVTDIWGNEKQQSSNILTRAFESFLAPYSKTEDITTKLDKEIKRVYNETGDNGIIPGVPYAYTRYNNETYRMSAKEYTKFKETYGQTANSTLNDLMKTSEYKNAKDETKVKMIENVYKYSRALANEQYFDKNNVDYSNSLLDKIDGLNINPSDYIATRKYRD